MGTSRFSGPVMYSGHTGNNTKGGTWFQNLPIGVNPDYVTYMDDFTGVDIDDTDDWTKQVLNSGTLTLLADHVNGWAKSTGDGSTDNSGGAIQGNEIFMAQANKNIFFEASVAVSDADDMDMFVGLAENGTFATGVPFTANNQIGFLLTEGDASIFANCDSGGTETKTDTGVDFADGAESGATITNTRQLGFIVKGTGQVEFYVDRALVTTTTANIPTSALTPWFCAMSGTTTADASWCDYIQVVAQRTTDGMTQFNSMP
ncbi:MAG TPA: hypothetical protein DF712_20370 [Balneola sp.]|nr:hypothetical protein [Balneola sp.]|tara:strand:- start:6501 stop:7280 length:780 start_codon:yes stop_codon:yes gene_type:complete